MLTLRKLHKKNLDNKKDIKLNVMKIDYHKGTVSMKKRIKIDDYHDWFRDLKLQIQKSQIKAALSVNSQLILLYWDIGRQISEKQDESKWGSGFLYQLSNDLKEEFPDMKGFSATNLGYCKRFFTFYSSLLMHNKTANNNYPQLGGKIENSNNDYEEIYPQVGGELGIDKILLIPWGHHKFIIDKCIGIKQAVFYINKTIENNWSRSILEYHIETDLYNRQGKAITNFSQTLPEPQSDLANEILKSSYNFSFLNLSEKVRETDLEKALVQHIQHFLLELGVGFAYMGRQYVIKIGDDVYRTDLLFYHTKLKCYVIIELKTKKFEAENLGKLNFYINAINELLKDKHDNPTIGLLLCKNKNNYTVNFSIKNLNNPIGVSTYNYAELADDLKESLPSAETIQQELENFEKIYAKI